MDKKKQKRYLKLLAKNIKYYRKQKRLNQKELAQRIKRNVRFISKLERGRYNVYITWLIKICTALEIRMSQLLDFDK